MMYFAGHFPASVPTMGISNSTIKPPPDRTSPGILRRASQHGLEELRHHHQIAEEQNAENETS
jgi:hypothetical protein